MILECPSCHNRYLVDPRAVGAAGRTVRCAKCRHEWFAEPPRDTPGDDVLPAMDEVKVEPKPIPAGSSVPAIPTPKPGVPQWLELTAVAALVAFLATAFIYFRPLVVEAVPGLKGTYAALGIYDSGGIVFAEMEYAQESDVTKDRHRIGGYLVNTSARERRLPVVSIALLDREGKLLRRHRLTDKGVMAPGEQRAFSQELTASPESARRVVIEAGSPFELKLR